MITNVRVRQMGVRNSMAIAGAQDGVIHQAAEPTEAPTMA